MKKLCSEKNCFKYIDTRPFPFGDVETMGNGEIHPVSLICYDCQSPEERKRLKNWRKARRHKQNKALIKKI